jgi:DNA-binding CsgD family transcriptional regulator
LGHPQIRIMGSLLQAAIPRQPSLSPSLLGQSLEDGPGLSGSLQKKGAHATAQSEARVMSRKWTDTAQKERAIALYDRGLPPSSIAERFSVSRRQVIRVLRAARGKLHPRHRYDGIYGGMCFSHSRTSSKLGNS